MHQPIKYDLRYKNWTLSYYPTTHPGSAPLVGTIRITFQIGADSMSSTTLMRDGARNEFKTSNSAVISPVIDKMKRTL